jgi:DNA-binding MarR family transcriptional regulator
MTQSSVQNDVVLAGTLLDVLPNLLRRVLADVPLDEESNQPQSGIKDISELRATPGQLSLLRVLVEHERCMMQDLAERLAVTPSTVTAMVKRLLAQGYVERSRDDVDWRAVWIKPTDRGRKVVAAFNEIRLAAMQKLLERLTAEERATITASLPALLHLVAL